MLKVTILAKNRSGMTTALFHVTPVHACALLSVEKNLVLVSKELYLTL